MVSSIPPYYSVNVPAEGRVDFTIFNVKVHVKFIIIRNRLAGVSIGWEGRKAEFPLTKVFLRPGIKKLQPN